MQPEAVLQEAIVRALRRAGAYAIRQRLQGRAGWPDVYAIAEGRAVHLEVKQPGERPEPLQVVTLAGLREAGAVVGVVSSVEEALEVLEQARWIR